MQLNGVDLVDRNNRPTVIQKVALRAFFINDGEYYDPFDISAVTIFNKSDNFSPSSVLDENLISPSIPSSIIRMNFGCSGTNATGERVGLSSVRYVETDPAAASSIYRIAKGEYVCVLDLTQETSGFYGLNGSSLVVRNTASAVTDYIDCWTVRFSQASKYQTLINEFSLYNDTFFTVTEPLIFATNNYLINKHLTLSSIETLKVKTDITIQNRNIDTSIRNLFKDTAIVLPQIKIEKVNEDSTTLPAVVTVSSFNDTRNLVNVTSDNTILFNFDTTTLATHPQVANFGGLTGTYRLTVKYNLLNDTIITKPFYFTIS
jgi:hypothetical protein